MGPDWEGDWDEIVDLHIFGKRVLYYETGRH
jgi:hypothetical protein